jgi:hypothetical protein
MSNQESPHEADYNPYAAPRAGIGSPLQPTPGETEVSRYAGRVTIIRLGGRIGLILSVLVFVTFGLGFLSEFSKIAVAEGQIDPWKYRVFIARAVSMLSANLLAMVTNWGLLSLRRWARWALSCAAILPVPVLILGYLSLRIMRTEEVEGSITAWELAVITIASSIYWVPILIVLWSRNGMAVFSVGHFEASRREGRKRSGCLPIVGAVAFAFSQGFVYTGLTLTVMSVLKFVGLLPSI